MTSHICFFFSLRSTLFVIHGQTCYNCVCLRQMIGTKSKDPKHHSINNAAAIMNGFVDWNDNVCSIPHSSIQAAMVSIGRPSSSGGSNGVLADSGCPACKGDLGILGRTVLGNHPSTSNVQHGFLLFASSYMILSGHVMLQCCNRKPRTGQDIIDLNNKTYIRAKNDELKRMWVWQT